MESFLYNICFIFITGILASGLKCFIDSEKKVEFLYRRSKCDSCKHILTIRDLIPIFSFISTKGKCRYCKKNISIDIWLYEVFACAVVTLYLIFFNKLIFLNIYNILIALLLIFLAIEDIKYYEVEDTSFILLIAISVILLIDNFKFFEFREFLTLIILYHILYIFTYKGMGYGDIKVFCVLAININFYEGIYLLIFTFLYSGIFALILLLRNKASKGKKIALIPFIAMAYITIVLIREVLLW